MRTMTVPLRRAWNAARKYRARAAMKFLRSFVARHAKVDEEKVRIHESVNHEIWKRGAQKPPRRIQIVWVKQGELVWVYTVEAAKELEKEKKTEKSEKKPAEKPEKKEKKAKKEKTKEKKEKEEKEKVSKGEDRKSEDKKQS